MKLKLTFQQAYDRIVTAYFKDELKETDCQCCFIGNLLGSDQWSDVHCSGDLYDPKSLDYKSGVRFIKSFGYTPEQTRSMERNFMDKCWHKDMNREDSIFSAMSSTLDMLKEIHIQNGEIIDNAPVFRKRELVKQQQ